MANKREQDKEQSVLSVPPASSRPLGAGDTHTLTLALHRESVLAPYTLDPAIPEKPHP